MAKRQTEEPALRRNINRWLADNCFGDYYTRNGLSDQEQWKNSSPPVLHLARHPISGRMGHDQQGRKQTQKIHKIITGNLLTDGYNRKI